MANTRDLQNRYKSLVTSLHKSFECPVCLETLKTPFKVCINGHGACLECIAKLEKCPLCQGRYILENLLCVKNMLKALPQVCQYSINGCEEVVEPGNNHEMYCGHRPIVCRAEGCAEKIPLVQLLNHQRKRHPKTFVFDKESCFTYASINPKVKVHIYSPVSLFENLFWVLDINDTKEKQYKIYFQATPIGKLEHDYYVRVKLQNGNFNYTYTLKAYVLSSCEKKYNGNEKDDEEMKLLGDQYCMKIPQNELCRFIDKGQLQYSCYFFRVSQEENNSK